MRLCLLLGLLAGCGSDEPAAPDAAPDAPSTHMLQLHIIGNGTVVRDDDGQRCRGACTLVAGGGTLSLTAAPDDGWLLDGWTGRCASHDPHIVVAVEGVVSCNLQFDQAPDAPVEVDAGTD